MLDLSELMVRWPQLADRLAAPTNETATTLEALAKASADKSSWTAAVERHGLVRRAHGAATPSVGERPSAEPPDGDVPLDELREFLERTAASVPLMAKLV